MKRRYFVENVTGRQGRWSVIDADRYGDAVAREMSRSVAYKVARMLNEEASASGSRDGSDG